MLKEVLASKDIKEAMERIYLNILLEKIKLLDKLCDIIVIPCNTVHYFEKYFKSTSKNLLVC